MLQKINSAHQKTDTRRTHAPVRRNSRLKNKCEAVFWKPIKQQDARQIVLAAKRYELGMKQPGNRNGPLGNIALEVLEYLINIVDFKTGRLEPAISKIMEKIVRSRGAVCRALDALRTHGFIDWLRRYEPTGNEGDAGPQVQQVSNAYRLTLPARAKAFLGKYGTSAPLPDDATQTRKEREQAYQAHMDSLTPADRIRETLLDPVEAEKRAGVLERRAENAAKPAPTAQLKFVYASPTSMSPRQRRIAEILQSRNQQKSLNEREFTERTESSSDFYIPTE
jgi:hypothetical protein